MSETVRTEESNSKNSYGDPPKISIDLPEISVITQNYKRWKDVQLPIDILLLTVKDCEFLSCYYYIVDPFRSYFKGLGHVYFGSIGEDQDIKLKVALIRCLEGAKAPGGSLTVVKNAVTQLRPKAVFSVGHCSGMNQETTKLGDVVLSKKLTTYSYQKATMDGMEFHGVTTPVSRDIAELIKCAGIYSAAHDLKMEWVVIKGISGYADGTEAEERWKAFASVMAASVFISIVNKGSIFEDWQHYNGDKRKSSSESPDQNKKRSKLQGEKRKSSSESPDQNKKRSKLQDSSELRFLQWSQNQLRECYSTMCQVKITPWDPDNTVHINDIYVQLTLLQDHRKPDGKTKKRLGDSSEVFEGDEHHPIHKRILVYGRPGIGKSTFTQKVAVDWADGKKEILKKFSLLLLIKLRDVCDIPDLCTMLETAELLSADYPMAVNNLCEYVRQNQEKVLLILDGYDEYSGGKSSPVHQIWRGSQLRDCCVMITTRPVEEDELRVPSHAQFEINGLDSREQKEQFVRKILTDEEDVKGLLDYLWQQDLIEMAEIPLLLLMLCLLYKEKKNLLPTSRAHIYKRFIQTLLNHMAMKESDNVTTSKCIDEYQEELSKIGKHAYDALLEDRLHFNFSKFRNGDLSEKLIHVGFFQVSKLSALNPEKVVYFLHKSVQEFLAAWFIVQQLTVKKNETVTCLSGMDTIKKSWNMAEVLKFACELSSEAAGFVFHDLRKVAEEEGLTNYKFTKTHYVTDLLAMQIFFNALCVDCLFLCPAADRTAVYSAFLSCVNHVVMLGDRHSSTAAIEHFFKSISDTPNYLILFHEWETEHVLDDVLSIMFDLNAIVLTSFGEIKDVEKYADLLNTGPFLKKSEGRNFIFLTEITDNVFHSELFPELISAPVCSSKPPVLNLVNNGNDNIALPLTENHCLSVVENFDICFETIEDVHLCGKVLPLVTALRRIDITRGKEAAFEDQLIEKAIYGVNLTDNLYSLELSGINLTTTCAAFIAESLHHSPNLWKLNLSDNSLHNGVSHLAKNLRHVPLLTILDLQYVQMGEKECGALAASLKYLNKLARLEIDRNAVGRGIIELVENLEFVPNLSYLNLRDTKMGEVEVSALARALKDVPELEHLDLETNPLGRGVRDLIKHLSKVPKLNALFLRGFQMTRREFEELRTAENGRNITVWSDYYETTELDGKWIHRPLTTAELKKRGTRFIKEPDDDDDGDDDDSNYSDDDDEQEEENEDDDDDDDDDDDYNDEEEEDDDENNEDDDNDDDCDNDEEEDNENDEDDDDCDQDDDVE